MTESLGFNVEGVICPVVTPFENGAVDEAALEAVIEWLAESRVDGIMPAGTTGEFSSLGPEEFETVVRTSVRAAEEKMDVLPGAIATDVETVVSRLNILSDAGADAGVITNPYFLTAKRPSGNERFLRTVADRSPLPIVLYNQPRFTGQPIAAETVLSLAEHERVVGIKDSGGDFGYFLKVARNVPADFLTYQGFDNYLIAGMEFGSNGGILALANAIPETLVEVYEAVAAGDIDTAWELHEEALVPLFELCYEHGFATVSKVILEERGIIPSAEVRPPLLELDHTATNDVLTVLRQL